MSSSFLGRGFALLSLTALLGAGCFSSPSPTPTETVVEIPADFPTDILRYPDAKTYVTSVQGAMTSLGQTTTSTMPDLVKWFNVEYSKTRKDLHQYTQQGDTKIYSFQDQEWRYTVRLEPADNGVVHIITQRVPLASAIELQ